MKLALLWFTSLMLFASTQATARETTNQAEHNGHQMMVNRGGVVMNENHSVLPRDCTEISRDYKFTIHAGRKYAEDIPGMMFGMSQHEVRADPCSRITVSFVNEDQVRHQWMVHGLPKYLYPAGMFHIEASGGQSMTGTFIVPADAQTYLIHCDMAQHMEKGMRGQLVIGGGSGNLWGVAGISDQFYRFSYLPPHTTAWLAFTLVLAFLIALRMAKKS
jgi:plastocyanin